MYITGTKDNIFKRRNHTIRENLKINTLERKPANNRIRLYGYVLKMNKERTRKKAFNIKVNGKCPREREIQMRVTG